MIVFKGGKAFSVHPLNGAQWGYSVVLGALSMLVAVTIRCIPDELIRKLIPSFAKPKGSTPQLLVSDPERNYEWNPALEEIREELTFLKKVRGGRLRNIAYKLQHPAESFLPRSRSGSRSRSRSNSLPQTPDGEHSVNEVDTQSPQTPESRPRAQRSRSSRSRSNSGLGAVIAGAGIIAGGVGGGWSPIERGPSEAESFHFSRSRAHSGVDAQAGIEVHPDTKPDDPIIVELPQRSKVPPSQNPDLRPAFDYTPPSNSSLHPPGRGSRSHSRHSSQSHG